MSLVAATVGGEHAMRDQPTLDQELQSSELHSDTGAK
jgi:hypothetical protein